MATIGSLSVNAVVKSLGATYNGDAIRWVVGHQDTVNGRTKLIAERLISIKCFDAEEASNPNSERRNYGNNRYSQSNIDQWLNSAAGAWYSARHAYDAPPTSANVSNGYNEYDTEAGFLSHFESAFQNAILDTTIRVVKNTVTDGGGCEDITRKVYLLSNTEVGLVNENSIAEGVKWDLFSNNNRRLGYPTSKAVSSSEYKDPSLNASSPWYWYLRTPQANTSHYARLVFSDGTLSGGSASAGNRGVRPALELASATLVSDTPDSDGAYIIQFWTPPSISVRIDGAYRPYSDGAVKIGGVWRTIDGVHTKIDGVWRKS